MADFPNDSDGMALQRMAAAGIDLKRPAVLEFHIDTGTEETSRAVANALRTAGVGDEIEIVYDEGELEDGEEMADDNVEFWPSWTVCVLCEMVPEYKTIVQTQEELDRLVKPHGGRIDGWGVRR
jgi:hypothetical protein